ncbi:MAG: O-antigen ligase family protein [Saprospiraceae bacterium]|nr:O-antigen ligase family protein [Saprospiraceae bacterium]
MSIGTKEVRIGSNSDNDPCSSYCHLQSSIKRWRSREDGRIFSLTGRLPFWKTLINEGLPREPLLGFGFMRIDYKEYFQGNNTYPGKMTYNTFMQVLMNLGLIGLVIVLMQFILTLRGILRENAEKKLMLLCLLIPLLINSFTEFGIFGESNYGILFYQLILMIYLL